MSSDYRLEIHSGKKGLEVLLSDWLIMVERLAQSTPSHFPYWYAAFLARPDANNIEVYFISIYRGSQLAAVFPVGRKRARRFNLVELTMPISEDLGIFPDAVVAHEEDHTRVFAFFLKAMKSHPALKWDVLVVRDTLYESHISKCLRGAHRYLTSSKQTGKCNYIRIDPFRDKHLVLSKNFRANLRKAKNLMHKNGQVEFECISDLPSVEEALSAFIGLEASGWKGKSQHDKQQYYAGSALALNESKLVFHQNLVRALAISGYVDVYKLLLNGKVVSLNIAVVLNKACYLLKITYDETYAKLSPGNVLLEKIIQHHALHTNVSHINLVSDYNWHKAWKPSSLDYVTYHCFNSTLKGATYRLGKQFQALLSRSKSPTEK